MNKEKFSLNMTKEERYKKLVEMDDDEIDCSDIPEISEELFKNGTLIERKPRTTAISLRVDTDVLEAFKAEAKDKGYQTLMNDVLRTYAFRQQQKIQTVDDHRQSPQQNDQPDSATL